MQLTPNLPHSTIGDIGAAEITRKAVENLVRVIHG